MVKATILFGRPGGEAAFQQYFEEVHLPAGARVPGLKRIETGKLDTVFSTDAAPNLYWVVDLWFETEQELEKALQTPEAQAAIAELPNFATGGVTVVSPSWRRCRRPRPWADRAIPGSAALSAGPGPSPRPAQRSYGERGGVFSDEVAAAAILDRGHPK